MAWYAVAMRRISQASRSGSSVILNYSMGGLAAVFWMWAWAPVRGMGLGKAWPFDYFYILSFSVLIITILGAYSFLA